jgi:hypothetical protein
MCRLTLSSAMQSDGSHSQTVVGYLLAFRLLLHDCGSTRSGTNPQRSSFSGIGRRKETLSGNGPTPAVSSRVGELLCHVERICQSGSDRDISSAPLFRIRDSSTALGMTKRVLAPDNPHCAGDSKSSALSAVFTTLAMRVHRAMPGVDARPVSNQRE